MSVEVAGEYTTYEEPPLPVSSGQKRQRKEQQEAQKKPRVVTDSADEKPMYEDDDDKYYDKKPIDPPLKDTPEYNELLKYCDEVEIILHVVNKIERRAAARFMEPPPYPQYKKAVNNFPDTAMVVGMFAGKKAALVKTQPGNECRLNIEEAIKNFQNAKYIILVGVCYAFDINKCKLGDVLVSNAICNMSNYSFIPDGVQDRGETINTENNLRNIFCNDETHDPPFFVSESRKSKVLSGWFVSFPVLMKDEEMRDKFHKVRDYAIAGEMEGGIVSEYLKRENKVEGAIVIKAAADYGNDKKNKDWQFTAAMAAFHYAKSKLKEVNLLKVTSTTVPSPSVEPITYSTITPLSSAVGGQPATTTSPNLESVVGGQPSVTPTTISSSEVSSVGPRVVSDDTDNSTLDGGQPASSPTPPSSNPASTEQEQIRAKMDYKELANWMRNEGINKKDVDIIEGLEINERLFMKLNEQSDELKDVTQATKRQIKELQKDLSS